MSGKITRKKLRKECSFRRLSRQLSCMDKGTSLCAHFSKGFRTSGTVPFAKFPGWDWCAVWRTRQYTVLDLTLKYVYRMVSSWSSTVGAFYMVETLRSISFWIHPADGCQPPICRVSVMCPHRKWMTVNIRMPSRMSSFFS